MKRLVNRIAALPIVALLGCVATEGATVREPILEPSPITAMAPPALAPAPQVMVSEPVPVRPVQVTIQPMTEAERTEMLRSVLGEPRVFVPAPLPQPPVREVVVYRDAGYSPYYGAPYYDSRYDRGYVTSHVHTSRCSPGCALGRVAVYTGLGAIIGHQYGHRGRGAAIGAGLALLTGPAWCGWSNWCGGY